MLRKFFVIWCLVGLSISLSAMKQEDSDKQEKVYEDFSASSLESPQVIVVTEFDENHDLLIIGSKNGSLIFNLIHKITRLTRKLKKALCPPSTTLLSINESTKELFFCCDNQIITSDINNYVSFPEKGSTTTIPIKMVSLLLDDKKIFRAIVNTEGVGVFGVFEGDMRVLGDKCYKLSKDGVYVTAVDALKITNEEFIIAFGLNSGKINFIFWKTQSNPELLKKGLSLTQPFSLEKITFDKETQKICLKLQNYQEVLYVDFPESIKNVLKL